MGIDFKLVFLPIEIIRHILESLDILYITRLWSCGDLRLNYLIAKGGVLESLIIDFEAHHSSPILPQLVYGLQNLRELSIICADRPVKNVNIAQLPSSVQFLKLEFPNAPHTLRSTSDQSIAMSFDQILPNLHTLMVKADRYCCLPYNTHFQFPSTISRLILPLLDIKHIEYLPVNLIELQTAFSSYKWNDTTGKLPKTIEKLVLKNVKHGRFMRYLTPNICVLSVDWTVFMGETYVFDDDMAELEGWDFLPRYLESFTTSTRSITVNRIKLLPSTLKTLDIWEEKTPSKVMDWLHLLPPNLTFLSFPLCFKASEVLNIQNGGQKQDHKRMTAEATERILSCLPRQLTVLPSVLPNITTEGHLRCLPPKLESLKVENMPDSGFSLISQFPLRALHCAGQAFKNALEIPFPSHLTNLMLDFDVPPEIQLPKYLTVLAIRKVTDSKLLASLPCNLRRLTVGLFEIQPEVTLTYLTQLARLTLRFMPTADHAPSLDFFKGLPTSLEGLEVSITSSKTIMVNHILHSITHLHRLSLLHLYGAGTIHDDDISNLPPKLHTLWLRGVEHELTKKFVLRLPPSVTIVTLPGPLLDVPSEYFKHFQRFVRLVMGYATHPFSTPNLNDEHPCTNK